MQLRALSRQKSLSLLGAVLAVAWLGLVGWRFLVMWRQALEAHSMDWLQVIHLGGLPAGPASLLGGGLLAWVAGSVVARLLWPTTLPTVVLAGILLICTTLLVTSHQIVAGLVVVWMGVVAGLIGLTLLDRLGVKAGPFGTAVLAVALGFGGLSLLTLALGLAGLLSAPSIWASTILLVLGLGSASRRAITGLFSEGWAAWRTRPVPPWLTVICLILLSLYLVLDWIGALAPEVMFDALKSHLALASIYARQQRVTGVPYSMGSYWPMNGEMLFTLGYVVAGETAAKLFHFSAGLLAAAMVYLAGRRLESSLTGIVAAVIFYTTPIIAWESTTAYIDLFWAMYIGGALVMLLMWLYSQRKWQVAAACGLFLGLALGVKPSAGFIAVGVGLVMLYALWRAEHKSRWVEMHSVIAVTGVAALSGGIWYVRAYLLTGNPVFPFLNAIFRSPMWYPRNEMFNYGTLGFGTSTCAIALLPWRLTYETGHFGEVVDGALGILLLAFVPLAVLTPKRARRLGAIVAITLIFSLLWAFSVQYLRYFLPAVLGLAVIAGWAAVACWSMLRREAPRVAWLLPVYLVVAAILSLPISLSQYWNIPTRVPYGVVLGSVSRDQYRAQTVLSYRTFQYANDHLQRGDRIYAVGEYFQYLSNVPLVTPFFSIEGNSIFQAQSVDTLLRELAISKITYILINRPALAAAGQHPLVSSEEFLSDHATLEYAANNVYLYRLIQPSEPDMVPCPEEERLLNGDFRNVTAGNPVDWTSFGKPAVANVSASSATGNVAAHVSGSDGYMQALDVSPGALYTLSETARSATESPANVKLQIVWQDRKGQPIDYSIDVIQVGPAPIGVSMSATAPEGSLRGLVYLCTYSGSAYVSKVSLLERTSEESCR